MNRNVSRCAGAITLTAAIALYLYSQRGRTDEPRPLPITCVNNLKMIEISLLAWANDHNGQYPWQVSTNAGGSKEFCAPDKDGFDANSFRHFQVMSNELNSPKVLVCPTDQKKKPAESFAVLVAPNVTYKIRVITGVTLATATTNNAPVVVCPVDGNALNYDASIRGNGAEQWNRLRPR